ncbi:MAG: hypothetical protein QNL62_24315 [Gammaproteobacteria bacterium]|nr:hypothetical protein [Gammaproteobacteria bacterium]
MTHIIVPSIHPFKYYGIRFLLLLLAAALLWGAFELGYMQSEEDIITAKGGRSSLIVQHKVLKKQNKELSKELLHLERKYLLEQAACQIVKSGMSKDLQKIAEIEKQLAFYKAIVSPDEARESIYLQSLEIVPYASSGKKQNLYQYKFIIAQKIKKRSYTKGTLSIFIKGKQKNKSVKLSLFDLITAHSKEGKRLKESKQKTFKYSFKYFQEFSGIISLPEGMIPKSVDIIIDSKKKKSIIELNDLAWSKTGGMKYVGQ